MQTYELQANFDSRASFYGKARVETNVYGDKTLISYTTPVATITTGGEAHVMGLYSATTTRHIKEFLNQHGFKCDNAKQIMKDYGDPLPAKTHQADFAS